MQHLNTSMQIMLENMLILHHFYRHGSEINLLTNPLLIPIILFVVALGAWCNGNTWVSKTFVEGSNPSAPAKRKSLETIEFQGSSHVLVLTSTEPYDTNRSVFCPFSLPFRLFTQITVKALLCILSGFFLNSLYTKFKFVYKVFCLKSSLQIYTSMKKDIIAV